MSIYLDNAASTQLAPEAFEAMLPFLKNGMGNPSSPHAEGRKLKSSIESARKEILKTLNCDKGFELVFTSGGTESNNIAIQGLTIANNIRNIITTAVEHNAVLDVANGLTHLSVHLCPVDSFGRVDVVQLEQLLSKLPNTLVSIMHGHNELGSINDISVIADLCRTHKAIFHSDTVQTIASTDWSTVSSMPDAFVASGHKFHGPKGIGFLVLKKGIKCESLVKGGGQEKGLRSGTENPAAIVGLAKALTLVQTEKKNSAVQFQNLRDKLFSELDNNQIVFDKNSPDDNTLLSTLNIRIHKKIDLATLLFALDLKGIQVSGGSACSSGALKTSRILNHLHGESELPSIRVSMSKFTTEADILGFTSALREVLEK
jgi:cysteine desulfurase